MRAGLEVEILGGGSLMGADEGQAAAIQACLQVNEVWCLDVTATHDCPVCLHLWHMSCFPTSQTLKGLKRLQFENNHHWLGKWR